MQDVIIIGGGASGLSAAITFGSAKQKFDWAKPKKVLLIDNGKSDLRAAAFWNAPGISAGKNGKELLADLQKQLEAYPVNTKQETVRSISKQVDGSFSVMTENKQFETKLLILATGMKKVSIESFLFQAIPHPKVSKAGKLMIKNLEGVISKNLYVTGLAAGHQTMFAIASGDGVRVACLILEKWGGNYFVPHDVAGS